MSKLLLDLNLDRELGELLVLSSTFCQSQNQDGKNYSAFVASTNALASPLPAAMSQTHVMFPAHLTGLCVIRLWRASCTDRVKGILSNLVRTIPQHLKYDDDASICFWLANLCEMSSILKSAQEENASTNDRFTPHHHHLQASEHVETDRVISKYRIDIEYLLIDIYNAWLTGLKRTLSKMTISAIVEHQGLQIGVH